MKTAYDYVVVLKHFVEENIYTGNEVDFAEIDLEAFWNVFCQHVKTRFQNNVTIKAAMRSILTCGTLCNPGTSNCQWMMPSTKDCLDYFKTAKKLGSTPLKIDEQRDFYPNGDWDGVSTYLVIR